MDTTSENLESAFAGESQANRKYLFFAEKADKEGYGRDKKDRGKSAGRYRWRKS